MASAHLRTACGSRTSVPPTERTQHTDYSHKLIDKSIKSEKKIRTKLRTEKLEHVTTSSRKKVDKLELEQSFKLRVRKIGALTLRRDTGQRGDKFPPHLLLTETLGSEVTMCEPLFHALAVECVPASRYLNARSLCRATRPTIFARTC